MRSRMRSGLVVTALLVSSCIWVGKDDQEDDNAEDDSDWGVAWDEEAAAELEEKARDLQGELEREDLMTDWEKLEEIDRSRSDVQEAIDTRLSEWESVEADLDRMRTHAEDPRCR